MTNDEILQAAKDAGIDYSYAFLWQEELERFAAIIEKIIEKRTIERCADECNDKLIPHISFAEHFAIKLCAAAIRKLGEQ